MRGYSRTVVEKPFRVVAPEEAESDIHIYGASYPTGTIRQGKGFSVKGSIFSSLKLVRVEGGVYKAEGATCDYNDDFTYTFNPNKASFGMVNFDNVIGFGKLPVGEFVFRIVAEDEKGTTVELIKFPLPHQKRREHRGQPRHRDEGRGCLRLSGRCGLGSGVRRRH